MCVEIPLPLTYNPYKHHFRFLLKEIENWRSAGWESAAPKVLTIGTNLIDLYTGPLSVEQVCRECSGFLEQKDLLMPELYNSWLGQRRCQKTRISDASEWLFKLGDLEERFVHIHPARYSQHGLRVRATTLKTVLALKVIYPQQFRSRSELLERVNRVRSEKLDLSPVKSLADGDSGILRLLGLFRDQP